MHDAYSYDYADREKAYKLVEELRRHSVPVKYDCVADMMSIDEEYAPYSDTPFTTIRTYKVERTVDARNYDEAIELMKEYLKEHYPYSKAKQITCVICE